MAATAPPVDAEAGYKPAGEKTNAAGATSQLQEITTDDEFASTISGLKDSALAVIYFHAPWAEPCKQMSTILSTLATTYPAASPPSIAFLSLNAEELPDISEKYNVTAVPYIVLEKGGEQIEKISGSDASKVRVAVEKHAGKSGNPGKLGLPPAQTVTKPAEQDGTTMNGSSKDLSGYAPGAGDAATAPEFSSGEQGKEDIYKRLEGLVKAAPVMLFMKGTPSSPQCGFSRQTVALLRERSIRYGFFNILADDDVRQGLKEYSDWPTFPQLYADGELVGGLDIVSLARVLRSLLVLMCCLGARGVPE